MSSFLTVNLRIFVWCLKQHLLLLRKGWGCSIFLPTSHATSKGLKVRMQAAREPDWCKWVPSSSLQYVDECNCPHSDVSFCFVFSDCIWQLLGCPNEISKRLINGGSRNSPLIRSPFLTSQKTQRSNPFWGNPGCQSTWTFGLRKPSQQNRDAAGGSINTYTCAFAWETPQLKLKTLTTSISSKKGKCVFLFHGVSWMILSPQPNF